MRSGRRQPIGSETLDQPGCEPELARATLADIARSNRFFGGRAAVWSGVARLLEGLEPRPLTLIDIGAGAGDVAGYVVDRAARSGITIRPLVLDRLAEATVMCRSRGLVPIRGDATRLPLAPGSVDLVVTSLVLHHLDHDQALALIQALNHTARLGVVIADLERSHAAAAGIWLASWVLGFHRASRHDGVISVRRGFTSAELTGLLHSAGVDAHVEKRPGYRLVAAWRVAVTSGRRLAPSTRVAGAGVVEEAACAR